MSKRSDIEFNVRWLPYQLNPNASHTPTNKMEAYMNKFGKSKEEVKQMSQWMEGNFNKVGLPYKFTEAGLVANTYQAHRVLTAAYKSGGAAAQDKAAESLFNSYFAQEKAPNDEAALQAAAAAAGLDGKALMDDKSMCDAEVKEEFQMGRQLGVRGVPHFVIRKEGSKQAQQISGAQPPAEFIQAFANAAR